MPSIITDNYFEDTRIPIGGNTAAGTTAADNRAIGRPRGGKS